MVNTDYSLSLCTLHRPSSQHINFVHYQLQYVRRYTINYVHFQHTNTHTHSTYVQERVNALLELCYVPFGVVLRHDVGRGVSDVTHAGVEGRLKNRRPLKVEARRLRYKTR